MSACSSNLRSWCRFWIVATALGVLSSDPRWVYGQDFGETRVRSCAIESWINPDPNHIDGALLDGFIEPVKCAIVVTPNGVDPLFRPEGEVFWVEAGR